MKFEALPLAGAYLVDIEPLSDHRGFFARTFCEREFSEMGLDTRINQCNISHNPHKGTLRGLHVRFAAPGEAKLVRCTRGAVHDIIVDLRPDSRTFRQHIAVELTARNRRALFIPPFFAHGFQTLDDETEVFYQITEAYVAGEDSGVRYNDPVLGLTWPLPVTCISVRDESWPMLGPLDNAERSP